MPEVPDLEAIRGFFNQRVLDLTITDAELLIPYIGRFPPERFGEVLVGNRFRQVSRYGKFLLFRLASHDVLVINAMLTGRFQYVLPARRKSPKTCAIIGLENGYQMRYRDQRLMGKFYLAPEKDLSSVPQFGEMGPDLLDPALTEEVFRERLRKYRGQIKSVLTNHKFVAGIGNAYSDEILFVAGLHPYRKSSALTEEQVGKLYRAIGEVMDWAVPIVAEKMSEDLAYQEWRDHCRVHRKGGEPCPVCGTPISAINAGGRETNFCRTCQGDREG